MGVQAMGGRTWMAAAGALAAVSPWLAGCADMRAPPSGPAPAVASRCSDERFPIYFARGSADLPPDARTVIRSASNRVAGCRITAVDVVGMTAFEAGAPVDTGLAQHRADNVAQALAAAGLPAPAFDIQVAGARRLPPAGEHTPLARRTEVVLHAEPSADAH